MKPIPTAEEMEQSGKYDDYSSMMIAFAKLHVEAALEAVNQNIPLGHSIDKEYLKELKYSILKAYPLTNIK